MLSVEERESVLDVLADEQLPEHVHCRARILLRCSEAARTTEIAKELGTTASRVSDVKHDFAQNGLEHVLANRSGGRRVGDTLRHITPKIAKEADELHKKGATFRELAKKFDFSPEGIRLAIERSGQTDDGRSR